MLQIDFFDSNNDVLHSLSEQVLLQIHLIYPHDEVQKEDSNDVLSYVVFVMFLLLIVPLFVFYIIHRKNNRMK
jgi:heme/copper-type cytochrome/quinol oxidase subunit 2